MANQHSEQTRAAVLAALLAGQSVSEVARQFHLSRATVRAWRAAAGLTEAPTPPANAADLGELIAGYLRELLATLTEQARLARDATWFRSQSGADAAVVHGVLADKALRILEAIDRDGDGG